MPRYRWQLDARAADETDATVVAEVLVGALRDERNDPREPVDERHHPLEGDDVVERVALELTRDDACSIADALDYLAGVDEGEHTDYDELVRLRDLILATPGVH